MEVHSVVEGSGSVGRGLKGCLLETYGPRSHCVVSLSKTLYPLLNPGRPILTNEKLFDLILYVPSTIFQLYRDGSSWVEPVLS